MPYRASFGIGSISRLFLAVALTLCVNATAWAGPEVPADSPLYRRLAQAVAQGEIADPRGGMLRATSTELRRWLSGAGLEEPTAPSGLWLEPVVEGSLRFTGSDEPLRPYSEPVRPRRIAGGVSQPCALEAGQPCGPGAGAIGVLDSAAGVGSWLTAGLRLIASGGNHDYSRLSVDRLYLLAESSSFQAEIGRDTLTLGVEAQNQLNWSANAPPVDQVRVSTAGFVPLFGSNPDVFRISALLFLARLDNPQKYPGALVSGQQFAIQLFRRLELSATRLLQFGGDGAPPLSFSQALAEHFTRRGTDQGLNYSNNRLGLGASFQLPGPALPRAYYSLVMEDTRQHLSDMLRYDSDHLVGLQWAALGAAHDGELVLEAWETGIRSGEHDVWTTGMTTGGYFVGSPLGPDAKAIAVATEWGVGRGRLGGTATFARLSSDRYRDDGENFHLLSTGTPELRWRGQANVEWPAFRSVLVQASAFAEEVRNFAFQPGASRLNVGGTFALVWRSPGLRAASPTRL